MAGRFRALFDQNPIRRDIEELTRLTTQYVKEETVQPVKDLGRFAAFGCLGSIFVGLGTLLALIGLLRLMQTETTWFHGHLSWLPYVIVALLGIAVAGLAGLRIAAGPAKRRLPAPKKDH